MTTRRQFIAGLGATAAWPLAARAQQPGKLVIGLLSGVSFDGPFSTALDDIRLGLRQIGFVEGQNLTIEYRTADGHPDRLLALAADLVGRRVALIIAIGGPKPVLAAKAATSTIPIVFAMGQDPVDIGVVRSLNRPEANVTGVSFTTLAPKRLDLLRELVPQATVFGYLDNVATSTEAVRNDLTEKARSIGRDIIVFYAGSESDIVRAFDAMARRSVGALLTSTDAYLNSQRTQVLSLARQRAIPTITPWHDSVKLGGLISYSPLTDELLREAGIYAGRILRGATPADLPVQLPTKFELAINLGTAKMLGLMVPTSLLAVADEVIE